METREKATTPAPGSPALDSAMIRSDATDGVERYLRYLTAGYPLDAGLSLEIRAIAPDTHDVIQRWFGIEPEYLARAAAHCMELAPTHDVYAGVLPRCRKGGFARDVGYGGRLFVDLDAGDGGPGGAADLLRRALRGGLPCPDVAVTTASGGAHLYWTIDPLIDLSSERETYRTLLKRVVRAIGGAPPGPHADGAATDEARVLRVPGTLYHKRTPPTVVQAAWRPSGVHARTAEEWHGTLPLLPVARQRSAAPALALQRPPEDDMALLQVAARSRHGARFTALYAGDTSAYGGDESRADMALARELAYWTGGDPIRVERLFDSSALGTREKWLRRPDYRRRTIDRAMGAV